MATIRSGNRNRVINAVSRNEFISEEGTVARSEMDSHADTCVAGPNFMILEFTGEQCDVTPYTNEYQPITNVPVVNAVTAFTDESSGETVILHFNQVLWYGKRMKMSLINPNQLRHHGMTVSDDPTAGTRPFGISGDGLFVPFQMDVERQYTSRHACQLRGSWKIARVLKSQIARYGILRTSQLQVSQQIRISRWWRC